jgi:hypothetical protein
MERGERLLINDLVKQQQGDDKLQFRKLALQYGLTCMKCPCLQCKGVCRRSCILTMEQHFIQHGQDPLM